MKALLTIAALAGLAVPESPQQPFSQAEYLELARRYARGERADAVARLGAWSERDLARQLTAVEQAARAAERCPTCPSLLEGVPLRAATMLHWDRDRAEQAPSEGTEQPETCPGVFASFAGRWARVLSRRPDTADFARRFFRMVTAACQLDACFGAADRWATDGIAIFPRDSELLLARGSVREERAVLGAVAQAAAAPVASALFADAFAAHVRKESLRLARRDFEDALAIDDGLGLARVRLARVLWRLDEPGAARAHLEALRAPGHAAHAFLFHLFLGRIEQEAGRLPQALDEYRLAVALQPDALSAGVALSNALMLAGDTEGARLALQQGLRDAGRRRQRDPFRDYLVSNALDHAELVEALYRESLE